MARPVLLKEAALDSPAFRSSTTHFCEQIDLVEKWLEGYLKVTGKLTAELAALESASNAFLSHVNSPLHVTEAVLDHDYALLALKRYGEGAKNFWSGTISTLKKCDALILEPIRSFINIDLRAFKVCSGTQLLSFVKRLHVLNLGFIGYAPCS